MTKPETDKLMSMLSRCLATLFCVSLWIGGDVFAFAEGEIRPVLLLGTPLEDFRLLHSNRGDIAKRSKGRECFVDVRGIVYLKGGSLAETSVIKLDGESSVKAVLEKCGVSCRNLWGAQVRLIKRDAIFQSPNGTKGNEKQIEEFEELKVGPGDVLVITRVL